MATICRDRDAGEKKRPAIAGVKNGVDATVQRCPVSEGQADGDSTLFRVASGLH